MSLLHKLARFAGCISLGNLTHYRISGMSGSAVPTVLAKSPNQQSPAAAVRLMWGRVMLPLVWSFSGRARMEWSGTP
ncbi:MAG: hypothetical protein ABIQ36_13945 [Rhodanobacter sp.]